MKKVIIIGSGPAGLSAGYILCQNKDFQVQIFESQDQIGGISKTVDYKGYKIDIGGHRFFSKNSKITKLRSQMLPIQGATACDYKKLLIQTKTVLGGPDPDNTQDVMLVRNRVSRIYYLRKFFDYPVSLSIQTIKNLGLLNIFLIGISYIKSKIIKQKESSLQDFFINKFGKKLYETFFKDYTKKVWGIGPDKIQASWGAQRIKGLSLSKALYHAIAQFIPFLKNRNIQTSLISQFWYPKYGPGQMRNKILEFIKLNGGNATCNAKLEKIILKDNLIDQVGININGIVHFSQTDWLISSISIKDLINCIENVDFDIKELANKLVYRDFITVGILVDKLIIQNQTKIPTLNNIPPDNWIYIQEPDVTVGRLQIFNNWSPYLVTDPNKIWLGMEYFCNENDEFRTKSDDQIKQYAVAELEKIGIIHSKDVTDSTVLRVEKAYPAYFGQGYENIDKIINYLNGIKNLICIGRNGMHKYNNMDHSMLTGMMAGEMIISNNIDKNILWKTNNDENYQES